MDLFADVLGNKNDALGKLADALGNIADAVGKRFYRQKTGKAHPE